MQKSAGPEIEIPVGVIVRKAPGVTRWAKWSWTAVGLLPGASPADWVLLRHEGDVSEYHAATLTLTLWATDAEAYMANLSDQTPSLYVVMRQTEDVDTPFDLVLITASPYEGQDYSDNGEDIVEKVPMPEGLIAWIRDFALTHHEDEVFVKRRRDNARTDLLEDGKGDARIRQESDVYRAPTRGAP